MTDKELIEIFIDAVLTVIFFVLMYISICAAEPVLLAITNGGLN